MPPADETLLRFPCSFLIKAMGWFAEDFDALLVGIVRKHAPDLADTGIEKRHSCGGRYISITVTIQARRRGQLDDIYRDLAAERRVLVTL